VYPPHPRKSLRISSKIHSLRNQYAYCHAADPDYQMQTFHPARHDLGCTKTKLTSSKETSWDVDIPKFGRLIYKSSRKLPDPTTTELRKKKFTASVWFHVSQFFNCLPSCWWRSVSLWWKSKTIHNLTKEQNLGGDRIFQALGKIEHELLRSGIYCLESIAKV
jgi:hypothetical protein